jgi:hypothetical protein
MRNEINCSVNVAHPYDNNVDMYSVVYLCLRSIYEYKQWKFLFKKIKKIIIMF